MKEITIFCSSSNEIDEIYFSKTEEVIRHLTAEGYGIKYGGGNRGLMGTVANTALKQGAKITGIIPNFMTDREWEHKGISDMIHVETMHQRKALLIKDTCAILALPGGIGTLEELCEVVAMKKLGLYTKPILVLNINGFYDAFIEFLATMGKERFLEPVYDKLITVVGSAEEIICCI